MSMLNLNRVCFGFALAFGIACGAVSANAASYNPYTDFSITNNNPNGVWSYYVNNSLMTFTSNNNNNPLWHNNGGFPNWAGIGIMNNSEGTVQAHSSALRMDPQNNTVTTRFTAPVTNTYSVIGYFAGNDSVGNAHPVSIDVNDA